MATTMASRLETVSDFAQDQALSRYVVVMTRDAKLGAFDNTTFWPRIFASFGRREGRSDLPASLFVDPGFDIEGPSEGRRVRFKSVDEPNDEYSW